MKVEKWKKVSCAETTISDLAAQFEVSGLIVDNQVKSITIFPKGFERGLRIEAGFDTLKLQLREPIRTDTIYTLYYTFLYEPHLREFRTEEERDAYESLLCDSMVNVPEFVKGEKQIEVYE
jgi:hypothetical protein